MPVSISSIRLMVQIPLFLLDGEETVPVVIKVVPYRTPDKDEDWEQEWNDAPGESEDED